MSNASDRNLLRASKFSKKLYWDFQGTHTTQKFLVSFFFFVCHIFFVLLFRSKKKSWACFQYSDNIHQKEKKQYLREFLALVLTCCGLVRVSSSHSHLQLDLLRRLHYLIPHSVNGRLLVKHSWGLPLCSLVAEMSWL